MANGTVKVSQVDVLTTSGTGTISIVPPATNTNRTLTLPDQTATVATLTTPSFGTTIGVGGATASSSGAGVSFPATQSASTDVNTLDDYEEGTWTPTITFGGNSVGLTYAVQKGNYTKVGNRVFASCYVQLSNKGSSTGDIAIGGLPFTSVNTANQYNCASIWANGLSSISGSLEAYNSPNTTTITSIGYLGTGAVTTVKDTNCANSSDFMINISYST